MTTQKPYLNTNEFLEMSEMLTSTAMYSGDPTQEYDIYKDPLQANQDWLWWLDNYLTNRSTAIYSRADLQTSGNSSVHWDNITNTPILANGTWKGPLADLTHVPAIGSVNGDTYLIQSTNYLLQWDSSSISWKIIGGGYFAPLNSPAFTGIPTAPTATAGTNTTQIATTAFVSGAIGGSINWNRDVITTTLIPSTATDYVNVGSGLKSLLVHTAIPFGESGHTSLASHFTGTSILGALNELVGSVNIVDIRNYSTIANALTAIGSTDATLFIPEPYDYGADTIIPSNVTLLFTEGGLLNATGTYSLTIKGNLIAPPTTIFTHTSGISNLNIIFEAMPHPEDIKIPATSIEYVYVEWFGTFGDGFTDDATAITVALESAYNGGLLTKATGTYFIDRTIQIQDQDVDFNNAVFIYDDGIYEFDGTAWTTWTTWASGTVYNINDYSLSSTDGLYYKCTVGGTSAGDDSNLASGSDTGCTWILASPAPFSDTAILLYNNDTINGNNIILNRTIKLPRLWKYANTLGPGIWTNQGIGVYSINLYNCNVHINNIRNFETGIKIEGDGLGNSYNNYYMGHVENCKIGLHLTATGGGWSNENNYYGGRFTIWSVERTYEFSNATASSGGSYTITRSGAGWTVNAYAGMVLEITSGTGSGQLRVIASNTSDTLTILSAWNWDTTPDSTSNFRVWDTISGTKGIYLEHTDNYPNNNVFYKPCLESNEYEYVIDCGGRQNQFIQPRYEGYLMDINLPVDARHNYFDGGFGLNAYGFNFSPQDTANKSRSVVITPEGDSIFNEPIKLAHRTSGTNMIAILPSSTEALTADISSDYSFAVSDLYVKTKGTTHTYDSIKLDIQNGRLYFGTGASAATQYIDAAGGNMLPDGQIHAFLIM